MWTTWLVLGANKRPITFRCKESLQAVLLFVFFSVTLVGIEELCPIYMATFKKYGKTFL